jgi:transcriptional regulator with XRE-family HTH domain
MDDRRVGQLLRQIRIERGWRQGDVAVRAGVSQPLVATIEAGRLERVSLPALRRVAQVLDCRVQVDVWWRGGAQDRLLDRGHAAVVEWLVDGSPPSAGRPAFEVGFNHFGDRGSADVVGWHAVRRALAIAEVKTRFDDLQAMHASFDRKVRNLPMVLEREAGWSAQEIGRLLVAPATHGNRSILQRHASTLATMWPDDGRRTRAWLSSDRPMGSMGGILLVPTAALPPAARPRQRIRAAR